MIDQREHGEASLYELLGVASSVTAPEIRRLRRDLARLYHPDVAAHPDAARLAVVLSACEVLGDPERKARYDAELKARSRAAMARRATGDFEREMAARRARRAPGERAREDFGEALRGSRSDAGAAAAPVRIAPQPGPVRAPRRGPRFDWDGAATRAFCYALGAATVPGYLTAFVIGGWLTPASVLEDSTRPVFINGPILVVLVAQAVLAASLSMAVDFRAWRRRVVRSQAQITG